MGKTLVITLMGCWLLAGCGKDKFNTVPHIEFKDVNTTELRPGQSIQFVLSYTDAEGDLVDSLYVEKITPNCAASAFKAYYRMPVFPEVKNSSGDILISYTYGLDGPFPAMQFPQCDGENDTCYFRFMLQDKAKNKSDTINSETIIIYR